MILVFGKTGQVATELQKLFPEATFLGREQVDLTDLNSVSKAIVDHRPDAVINAAAYTAVDNAETDESTAELVNCQAPGVMASTCAELQIPLVHISTDYVFDGEGENPFTPSDQPSPVSAYGRSKLAGEQLVENSGAAYAILRTSWVFSAHGNNFVKTMFRLSETRDKISVVADQIGGPTPAQGIASTCISLVSQLIEDKSKSGTYHYAGTPDVSWADFARDIFRQAKLPIEIEEIPTSGYPTPAKRPENSRLDCESLNETFSVERPSWKSALTVVIAELEKGKKSA